MQAASDLVCSLDGNFATRAAEEYILDELIAVAVGLVQAELSLAHEGRQEVSRSSSTVLCK